MRLFRNAACKGSKPSRSRRGGSEARPIPGTTLTRGARSEWGGRDVGLY